MVAENLVDMARELDVRRKKREWKFTPIPTRAQEARLMSEKPSPLAHGHAVMDAIRAELAKIDATDKPRSSNQVLIHTKLMSSLCMRVYGRKCLVKYENEIKRYNGFLSIRQENALTMPRRSGKSEGVAQFLAAAMKHVVGFDCACFAASKRSASKDAGMLKIVLKYLTGVFGVDEKSLHPNNSEAVGFRVNGDLRLIKSFPGSQDALRGVGGNFIVVEESAYVKEEAYFNVIVPLLAMDDMAFLALSTLGEDRATWFNKLIASPNLVESHVVKYICDTCEKQGRFKACIHNEWMIPQWSNSERMQTQMNFYGEERREVFLRESVGLVRDESEDCVFSAQYVREAIAAPAVQFHYAVKQIFVTVDPVAGTEIPEKNMSDFAVVAIASPLTVIMGMEALNITTTEEYRPKLHAFLTKLRSHPMTQDATIVLDVEMGTGLTAPDVYKWTTEEFRNLIVVNDLKRKQGSQTLQSTKQEMMEITRLALLKGEIRFWDHFVTSDLNAAAVKGKWSKQMLNYRRMFVKGKSITSKNTCVYSGKGENKNELDDLCVTFQRAVRLRDRYEHDPTLRSRFIM